MKFQILLLQLEMIVYHIIVLDAVNTSAQNINNWVQLTSSNIDAAFITSGIISTARLGVADTNFPANSTTFLRGDQKYAPVTQFVRVADNDTPILLDLSLVEVLILRKFTSLMVVLNIKQDHIQIMASTVTWQVLEIQMQEHLVQQQTS